VKLDLACGQNRAKGWVGVDVSPDAHPDVVADLRLPWIFPDECVTEARCLHFFEHLTPAERIHFACELDRVLVPGGTCTFVTPLGFNRMVQDPDHKWPPVVKGTFFYFSKRWRDENKLSHYERLHGLRCDLVLIRSDMKYDPTQFPDSIPPERLELLLLAHPDAQTDLVSVLQKPPLADPAKETAP
jgi:predicted SAM-dependent methyltransferase